MCQKCSYVNRRSRMLSINPITSPLDILSKRLVITLWILPHPHMISRYATDNELLLLLLARLIYRHVVVIRDFGRRSP